eukprot:PhF_6_TR4384/c0_g1_i1/m.5916
MFCRKANVREQQKKKSSLPQSQHGNTPEIITEENTQQIRSKGGSAPTPHITPIHEPIPPTSPSWSEHAVMLTLEPVPHPVVNVTIKGWKSEHLPKVDVLQHGDGDIFLLRTSAAKVFPEEWSVYNPSPSTSFQISLTFYEDSKYVCVGNAVKSYGSVVVVVSPGEHTSVVNVAFCTGYILSVNPTDHTEEYIASRRSIYTTYRLDKDPSFCSWRFCSKPVWFLPPSEYHEVDSTDPCSNTTKRPWDNVNVFNCLKQLSPAQRSRIAPQAHGRNGCEYVVPLFVRGLWVKRTVDHFIPCVDNIPLCSTDLIHKALADLYGGFEESKKLLQHEDIVFTYLFGFPFRPPQALSYEACVPISVQQDQPTTIFMISAKKINNCVLRFASYKHR